MRGQGNNPMDTNGQSDGFDVLDAFFSAHDSSDPEAMQQAAESLAAQGNGQNGGRSATRKVNGTPHKTTSVIPRNESEAAADAIEDGEYDPADLAGKFIAIDPDSLDYPSEDGSDAPFILIPAHIHSFLPWWGWLTIGIGLAMMMAGVLLMPVVTLNRLTSRLDNDNPAVVQAAMRQLVVKGDEHTVNRLFDIANSDQAKLPSRLRAIDTLALIRAANADRALLRLELADSTDAKVREAAIAARRQREAARTRGGQQ